MNTTVRKIGTIAASLFAALALSAVALAQAPTKMAGGVMADSAGMTLYVFDKDAGGKSACNGPCAAIWPPLLTNASKKNDTRPAMTSGITAPLPLYGTAST